MAGAKFFNAAMVDKPAADFMRWRTLEAEHGPDTLFNGPSLAKPWNGMVNPIASAWIDGALRSRDARQRDNTSRFLAARLMNKPFRLARSRRLLTGIRAIFFLRAVHFIPQHYCGHQRGPTIWRWHQRQLLPSQRPRADTTAEANGTNRWR
ncbi:hypothetical protein EH240_30065 [Mesorhizobium tamadayense]|uniref:Uncharacterized protein n=1 Tax=Mesorhizobium tamadayense TaxID=425306 RepID=A0A3P3F4P2_9HYPH|nr:hypothetical protein [Mesorhizobium tamadayense]RRH93196.1 hypothetical protein EH240_30065 [Mesorhizobium tamadayense]